MEVDAASFVKTKSDPFLYTYFYWGLESVSPPASLIEIPAFISFGPQMGESMASISIYEVVHIALRQETSGKIMLERNPENSPRCKAVLIENTWKYLPFNLGRPHWWVSSSGCISLCSSCKLIFTNLQDMQKNVPPSLSASTPC